MSPFQVAGFGDDCGQDGGLFQKSERIHKNRARAFEGGVSSEQTVGCAHQGIGAFAARAQNRRDRACGGSVPGPRHVHCGSAGVAARANGLCCQQYPSAGDRRQNPLQSLSAQTRSRPTARWRARRSAETVRRPGTSRGEGFVDVDFPTCASCRRGHSRAPANSCRAAIAAEIQLYRFARERAGAAAAETYGTEFSATICGFQHSTARRRSDYRRSTARQAAQSREDSDQRAVHCKPARGRRRVCAASGADGYRRKPAPDCRRGQAVRWSI
jgi:hypothetical protein